ncbi:MAG: bifunctional methylenetetrahydrofolate dehydrogenase/methenyltetrahydrofolate cyclohydrolase FolD [Bdellovibrionales bacterium]|nr:bifunctional methylenetetrahydrofolate dehydrogenase/methenyltetrahydrofolate cyclohydrolase FolD [Bdellovibrionales bacterium]
MKLLDGKWLASQVQRTLSQKIDHECAKGPRKPGLGVILVGENPASLSYVKRKEKVAEKTGFRTFDTRLASDVTFEDVASAIDRYNQDPNVDGILLQLPLPSHLDSNTLLDRIRPDKDADGLHPVNQGLLMRGEGVLRPCTPKGTLKLLDLALSDRMAEGDLDNLEKDLPAVDLSGKSALVVGRSILVGKPVALLLLERNATVTLAHSRTENLKELVAGSDIVVAAVGKPHMIPGDWVREGTIVLDVGINRLEDGTLTGDVDFESARKRAAAITPAPGGVGPMTVAMLLENTFFAYQQHLQSERHP